jgi:hypothetical protein
MENTEQIKIEHFVVHILDNKTPNLVLSDFECPISEEIQKFLVGYINYTMKSERNRIAKFNRPDNLVEDACNMMLQNPKDFINQSKRAANRLYTIMEADKRISEGDLLVCTYSTKHLSFFQVAIFKIDLTTAFFHDISQTARATSIVIRPRENAFPPPANLQKCVSIRPPEPEEARKDYDLVILDNQISAIEEGPSVRNFFCKTFLDCRLVLNDRDRTKRFRKITEEWLREKEEEGQISDREADNMRNLSIQTLLSGVINIPSFANVTITDDELRKGYMNNMREKGLPDMQFTPDPPTVQKYTKKRKFKGDHGLYIEVNAKNFDDVVEIKPRGPDNKKTIIIRTINWREVDRK